MVLSVGALLAIAQKKIENSNDNESVVNPLNFFGDFVIGGRSQTQTRFPIGAIIAIKKEKDK